MSLLIPVLLAKNWAIGYVVVAVCVLIGCALVCRPVKRKRLDLAAERRKSRK
ncbi:MAG: hypothetical protein ABGX07_21465 [Pirellulaceae bacterium]